MFFNCLNRKCQFRRNKLKLFCLITVGFVFTTAWGNPVQQTDWAGPKLSVSNDKNSWVIAGEQHKVTLKVADLSIKVEAGQVIWQLLPSAADDLRIQAADEVFPLSLTEAGKIDVSAYETGFMSGVKIHLSRFKHKNKELARVQTMCVLNKRLGLVEMTNHEFIDGGYRKQRTTFADGTTVTIDFDADTFDIEPVLKDVKTILE
jgi:hypothetical protein